MSTSSSLRGWYLGVFGVGAAAIAAGIVLAPSSLDTGPERAASQRAVSPPVVLVSTYATNSIKAEASANQKWMSKITPVKGRLQDALESLNDAAQAQDFVGMHDSCVRLGAAANDLAATQPSPREDLTAAIQDAVDNFKQAGSKCDVLTPEAGQDAVQGVLADVQNGVASLQQAAALLDTAGPTAKKAPKAKPLPPLVPPGRLPMP
jgi:hypothetical protein